MRRLALPLQFLTALAVPGMLAVSLEADAAPPIRTANSRLTQLEPLPTPLPPAPVPGNAVAPAPGPTPLGGGLAPIVPVAPQANAQVPSPQVPSPDGNGPMYYQPFGTMRDRTPPPKQYLGDPNGQGTYHTPTDAPTPTAQPVPPLETHAPDGITDRFGIAPPPGTLGRTYYRRTKPIEDKKHPRVSIVQVYLSENYDVSSPGMKAKWTGKYWELESDPLLPGLPHIVEIAAEWGPEGARQREVRTIRLIMGRVMDVEF